MNDVTNKLGGLSFGQPKAQTEAIKDTQEKQENQQSPETLKEPPAGADSTGAPGGENLNPGTNGDLAAELGGADDFGQILKTFTSHPILSLQIGKFKFDQGVLNITNQDDLEQFESILKKLPPAERNNIKTISLDLANKIALESGPVINRGFDSGRNASAEQLKRNQPTVGTTDMGAKESGN